MNECNIVKDLMPLYADELLSSDSLEFIQRHVAGCSECRNIWNHRDQEFPGIQAQDPVSEKKIIKKSLRRDRLKTMAKTLITVLLVLAIPTCYALQTIYNMGLMYEIEASYPSPDGTCVLELVDRDTFNTRSDGYLIRFKLDRGVVGINRYWTDWDTIEAHWAPDSIHLLMMVTNMEDEPEIYIVDTIKQETQGGTWDIPGLSENLAPIIAGLCKSATHKANVWTEITFTFNRWEENSELIVFDYETNLGQQGQITYHWPTQTLADLPW